MQYSRAQKKPRLSIRDFIAFVQSFALKYDLRLRASAFKRLPEVPLRHRPASVPLLCDHDNGS
jgi:hypothetical protein